MTTNCCSFARATLATLITTTAAAPAAAAPQQSDVLPPDGFVATCAASTSGANYLAYGGHLAANWSNAVYDGKYACNSQSFSGADGSGIVSAGFVAPNIANAAQGRASMGLVQLAATNSSPANTFFAQGAGNGGWSDSSVVAIDGLSGSAIWLFDVEITGALSTLGGSAAFAATAYKNEVELSRFVAGFRSAERCRRADRRRTTTSVALPTADGHFLSVVERRRKTPVRTPRAAAQQPSCEARSSMPLAAKSNSPSVQGSMAPRGPRSSGRWTYAVRSPQAAAARRSLGCAATIISCCGGRSSSLAAPR